MDGRVHSLAHSWSTGETSRVLHQSPPQCPEHVAYAIGPRQTPQVGAQYTSREIRFLRVVDCHLDHHRTPSAIHGESLPENRLRVAVPAQDHVLHAHTPTNRRQVIVREFAAGFSSQS